MLFNDVLDIRPGEIVALVGAGGKTTTMYRLARELAARGRAVVATTTTAIRLPEPAEVDTCLAESDEAAIMPRLQGAVGPGRVVGVVTHTIAERKVKGISPELVQAIADLPTVDNVIVEADGAKERTIKAPAEHEPVIPTRASRVLVCVGADAIGQPLDERVAHRIEQIAAVCGMQPGETLTVERVAQLLGSPRGGLQGVPAAAEVWALVTKAAGARAEPARRLARLLARRDRFAGALLATLDDVRPIHGEAGVAILAAGRGVRFGDLKQVQEIDGRAMVARVADVALASASAEVVAVVGYEGARVTDALAGLPLTLVENPDWERGQSTSMQAGLLALSERVESALFLLGDQPWVGPATIDRLLDEQRRRPAVVLIPTYHGRRGNPCLFSRAAFPALLELRGDQGGRGIFAAFADQVREVPVDDPAILRDVDTPEDLERSVAR